jgi:hypothetical protein
MKRLFIVLIVLFATRVTAQSPLGSGLSPTGVVDHLWKEGTEGELLTSDGWNRASRFFAHHDPFPENGAVRIVSNSWGIEHSSVHNGSAEVVLEYWEAGTVDATLRYTPPTKTEFYKNAIVYHLVLAPTHWTMFKSDGKGITGKEEKTGPDEWQIQEPAGPSWTTVNTAVRYVLERREKSKDPVIRKNAEKTLSRLLKLH